MDNDKDTFFQAICNERTTAFNRRLRSIEEKIESLPSAKRLEQVEQKLENYPTMEYILKEMVQNNKDFQQVIHDISLTLQKINGTLTDLDEKQEEMGIEITEIKHYTKQEISAIKQKIDEVDNKSKIDLVTLQTDDAKDKLKTVGLIAAGGSGTYIIVEIIRYIMQNI